MPIILPQQIVSATFGGAWISSVRYSAPAAGKRGSFDATINPWNGGEHLLLTGARTIEITDLVGKRAIDARFAAILDSINANLARVAANNSGLTVVTITAKDPTKPIVARAQFADGRVHTIHDCAALMAVDPEFAQCFQGALLEIARQAGLVYA